MECRYDAFQRVQKIVLQFQAVEPYHVCKDFGEVDCVFWEISSNTNYRSANRCWGAFMRLFRSWVQDGNGGIVPSIEVVKILYCREIRENRRLKSFKALLLDD